MRLPEKLKSLSFLISYLTLALYMLMRAIQALVYPFESEILSQSVQSSGGELYFLELEFATPYISNSVLFPIALVILYRLSALNLLKPVIVILFLHYSSAVAVLGYAVAAALDELDEANIFITQYEDDRGNLITTGSGQLPTTNQDGSYIQVLTDEAGNEYYLDDANGVRQLEKLEKVRLTFSEWVTAFYSIGMSFLLVFAGLFCIPYLLRVPFPVVHTEPDRAPEDTANEKE